MDSAPFHPHPNPLLLQTFCDRSQPDRSHASGPDCRAWEIAVRESGCIVVFSSLAHSASSLPPFNALYIDPDGDAHTRGPERTPSPVLRAGQCSFKRSSSGLLFVLTRRYFSIIRPLPLGMTCPCLD